MFKIHHIDIWINNIEESIKFYKFLGFKKIKQIDEKEKNKKIVLMEKDKIILEMKYHYNDTCEHNKVKCEDNKVLGMSISNINEAKLFIEKNNLTNEEIIIKKGILGQKYFIIEDPNGVNIEFIEENN